MLHDSCIHSKYTHLHPLQYGDDAYSIDVFVVDRFGKSGKSSARRARDAAMSADRELTGSHVDLASKIDQYFEAWNSRDLTALRALFDERVELHDWNVRVTGEDDVVKANAGIFDAFPNVCIVVRDTLVCVPKRAVTCEIEVHLKDVEDTKLTVVDVIRFTGANEICSVRAYKM